MGFPWTVDELRGVAATGAEVAFFDRTGEPAAAPPALDGLRLWSPPKRVDKHMESVHGPDRSGAIRCFRAALAEPGVLHRTEVRAQVGDTWLRFGIRFFNALDDPEFGVLVRILEFIEALPGFDPEPDRPGATDTTVPWVRLVCDHGVGIVSVEGSPERLYGVSAEELVGRSALDFVHPDDIGHVTDLGLRAAVGTDAEATAVHRLRRADGATIRAEVTMTVSGDRPDQWTVLLRDADQAVQRELAEGLAEGQLFLVYQPVVEVGSATMRGAEALVRWVHPERGFVPPLDFIPQAEASGLIVELGAWVLRTACEEAMSWPEHLHVAVNLSVRQLVDASIVTTVAKVLADTGLAPNRLVLEVTESALMEDADRAIGHLARLKSLGIGIAIDDFGTGFSSLQYLKRMPVDILKVDRSFVAGLDVDPGDLAIVSSVVALARAFELEVVAEGVETEDQHRILVALGCESAQGFLWSRPAPADQFQTLLDRPLATSADPVRRRV